MFYRVANAPDIGKVIRHVRKNRDLRQSDVAGAMNSGRRMMPEIEKGKNTAHIGKVLEALEILGINIILVQRGEDDFPDGEKL